MNGSIDVTFGREVDHTIGLVLIENTLELGRVQNVHLLKYIIRQLIDVAQILQITRVSQCIQINDPIIGILGYKKSDNMRTDEAGAACE
jgi:hypothetical protein